MTMELNSANGIDVLPETPPETPQQIRTIVTHLDDIDPTTPARGVTGSGSGFGRYPAKVAHWVTSPAAHGGKVGVQTHV